MVIQVEYQEKKLESAKAVKEGKKIEEIEKQDKTGIGFIRVQGVHKGESVCSTIPEPDSKSAVGPSNFANVHFSP